MNELTVAGWTRVLLPYRESYSIAELDEMQLGLMSIKETINPGCVYTLDNTLRIRKDGYLARWTRDSDGAILFNAYLRKDRGESSESVSVRCLGCSVDAEIVSSAEIQEVLTKDLAIFLGELESDARFSGLYFYYETSDPKVLYEEYTSAFSDCVGLYSGAGGTLSLELSVDISGQFTILRLANN